MTNDRYLLNQAEIAKRLSVSERTVRYWQSRRVIPFIKIGHLVRFNPDAVFAALGKFNREAIA